MIVGTLVDGKYLVNRSLGSGGSGSVFAADDQELSRAVAIKLLDEKFLWDTESIQRFQREARLLARVAHPNVLRVFSFGLWHDKVPYLVCELLDGESLRQRLASQGKLDWKRALNIAKQVCCGLKVVHDADIVHRDLKPENLVITSDGIVKIIDFGLSKPLDAAATKMTATGLIVGTPAYMSPEQARGEPASRTADIYSLGCILFEMLTGGHPFTADDPLGVLYKHTNEDLPSACARDATIPVYVQKILQKACAKRSAARYRDAEEMRLDLETALNGTDPLPEVKYHAPRRSRTGDDNRRRTTRMAAAGTGAVLLLAVVAATSIAMFDPGAGAWFSKYYTDRNDYKSLDSVGQFFLHCGNEKAAQECFNEAAKLSDNKAVDPLVSARIYLNLARTNRALEDNSAAIEAADKAFYKIPGGSTSRETPMRRNEIAELTSEIVHFIVGMPNLTWSSNRDFFTVAMESVVEGKLQAQVDLQLLKLCEQHGHPQYQSFFTEHAICALFYAIAENDVEKAKGVFDEAIIRGSGYTEAKGQVNFLKTVRSLVFRSGESSKSAGGARARDPVTPHEALTVVFDTVLREPMAEGVRARLIFQINRSAQRLKIWKWGKTELDKFATQIQSPACRNIDKAAQRWTAALAAYDKREFSKCVRLCADAVEAPTDAFFSDDALTIINLITLCIADDPSISFEPDILRIRKVIQSASLYDPQRSRYMEALEFCLFLINSAAGRHEEAARHADAVIRNSNPLDPLDYDQCHRIAVARMDAGDAAGARRILEKTEQIASKHFMNWRYPIDLSMSRLLAMEGNIRAARQEAEKAYLETQRMFGPDHTMSKMIANWYQKVRDGAPREELGKIDLKGPVVWPKHPNDQP